MPKKPKLFYDIFYSDETIREMHKVAQTPLRYPKEDNVTNDTSEVFLPVLIKHHTESQYDDLNSMVIDITHFSDALSVSDKHRTVKVNGSLIVDGDFYNQGLLLIDKENKEVLVDGDFKADNTMSVDSEKRVVTVGRSRL